MQDFIKQKRAVEIKLSLVEFLKSKPLYYNEIDYTRMPRAYASIKKFIKIPKVIHLVGTNGKGTTGRYIANALYSLDKKVGHYTSPHIQDFNERIWLNGKNVKDNILELAHKKLLKLLDDDFLRTLSYFEYTTFLAMIIYENCDYVVLEAGLGGEFDATNVFAKVLSVITPIGLDHEDFLGNSIEKIALTKLKSVTSKAIIANQKYEDVQKVIDSIKDKEFVSYKKYLDADIINMAKEIREENRLPLYLQDNLLVAMSVLKELGYEIKKYMFNQPTLEGRMELIHDNIWLDLGHNYLAAEAIKANFEAKSINLVYNSYKDKDYLSILKILAPIIKRVEIIDIDDSRIALKNDIIKAIQDNNLKYKDFTTIKKDEKYLVFGSFSVAAKFKNMMKEGDCFE